LQEQDASDTGSKRYENRQNEQTVFALHGNPNWRNFPTQSPFCNRDDGFAAGLSGITFPRWRIESIKVLGNSIVYPLIYEILKIINEIETNR
jgi:DNA (cytosine-5)-methyltransferase 1